MYSTSALLHLLVVNARQYSIVKDQCFLLQTCMVGLGRIELPTSPLSGVRSSQLSYRPVGLSKAGGAGRDRTGDLLNANQALSQLSYSPLKSRGQGPGARDQRLLAPGVWRLAPIFVIEADWMRITRPARDP